jgi:competence protein ComEA
MRQLSSGQRVGIMAILVIVTIVIGVSALRAWQTGSSPRITLRQPAPLSAMAPPIPPLSAVPADPPETSRHSMSSTAILATSPPDELVVHIVGAVRRPGVYHLHSGARWDDAIHAAGGPTAQANTNAINLAARLTDGTQLYVPTRQQHPEDHAVAAVPLVPAVSTPTGAPVATSPIASPGKSVSKAGSDGRSGRGGRSNKLTSPDQGQIDLNTATAAELQRIPGIGPSMAERLIAYRQENGGFHSVEDLLQVSGIGEKKYEKMKSFVKVGGQVEIAPKTTK